MRRAVAVLVASLSLAACAAKQKPSEFVWPLPPDKPRIRFVRAFSNAREFNPSTWSRVRAAITGKDNRLTIVNPTALALSPDDRHLYVSCPGKGYVLHFDRATGLTREFPFPEGYAPKVPYGLAVDADGSLFVADSGGGQVWVYAPDGKFVRRIGSGLLERPVGVAIDRRRRQVYVVDGGSTRSERHLVETFASDGRHIRTIGRRGDGPGEFFFPTNAAVAPNGNLYVADTFNARVEVFDPDGNLVTSFGHGGDEPGAFSKVKGLAFDMFGNLHAVDGQTAFVQIFNAKHQTLLGYGGPGGIRELMSLPNGIVVDAKNHIFVADFGHSAVKEYELFNTTAAESFDEGPAAPPPPGSPAASAQP